YGRNHASGIKHGCGAEVLSQIGMDTVQLDGKHFKAHVSQGEQIEKGQLLIEFDIKAIEKEGYNRTTPVVITNYDQYKLIETVEQGNIQIGDTIITII